MSNGQFYTFDFWGWNSTQTPGDQRARVQAALDSGERLLFPTKFEPVTTDGPCFMDYSTSLIGTGSSIWNCADKDEDILVIRSSYSTVERVHFDHPSGVGEGRGVVVGPTPGPEPTYVIYNTLRDIFTSANNKFGVDLVGAGGCRVDGGSLWGDLAAWHLGNILSGPDHDAGDHKCDGVDTNANPVYGAGYLIETGGGIYIGNPKGGQGQNHIKLYPTGSSGNLTVTGGSLEGCTGISADIFCTVPWERVAFTGVSFGVPSTAIAVRNTAGTRNGSDIPNLKQLAITGCLPHTAPNAGPVYDIGSVSGFSVAGGAIDGGGAAQCGVYVRAEAANGKIIVPIVGCLTPVINSGAGVTVY